jgi:hypothetical protein
VKLLLAALLAATLTGAPVPVTEAFNNGETLDYTLTWLKVTGGSARMTIAPLPGTESRYRITSVAKSSRGFRLFRFRDEIETVVTRDEFSTVSYQKKQDERGDKKQESTVIDPDGNVLRNKSTWNNKPRRFKIQNPVLDPISVIYYLRTLDLTPGKTYELRLLADGKRYNVHAKVTRREVLQTDAGTFKTVVVEPIMEADGVEREEKLYIWFSDDDRRLPVRIRTDVNVGSITATLKAVTPGVRSTEPATAVATKSK